MYIYMKNTQIQVMNGTHLYKKMVDCVRRFEPNVAIIPGLATNQPNTSKVNLLSQGVSRACHSIQIA